MKAYLNKWMEDVKAEIQTNLESTGTNASGKTSKSLRIEETEMGARILGRKAFGTVEVGRKAGKIPLSMNKIIRQWIIDKGITWNEMAYVRQPSVNWQPKYTPSERGLRALAGAISHTIMEKGTELFREGGRKDIYTNVIKNKLPILKKNIKFTITKQL